jgi:hypothetical protein
MKTADLIRLFVVAACGLGVAIAADPLDQAPGFTPAVSFTESHSEKVVGAAGSRTVAVTKTTTATVVANVTGITLANINQSTAFSLNFGSASISFTLGDIPTYTPGQTTAFYCWNGWGPNNKNLGTGGVKLTWTATKLTVNLTMGGEANRPAPIIADGFLGAVDPETGAAISLKDSLDVDVSFGPISSVQRKVYFTGKSSVTHSTFGSGGSAEEFDLNAVTLSGAADYASPTVALLTPKQGASVGPSVTFTGKSSDEHGLDNVLWSPDPITPLSWQQATSNIITPPANGLWGATTSAWTLDLNALPHGITKVWVKSVDESRNESVPLAITVVNPLLAPLPGRWDAALTPSVVPTALRGALYFTFAANGACSGQLTLEGMLHKFTGGLRADESLLVTIKRSGQPDIVITGTLGSFNPVSSAASVLNGTITINATSVATFEARRTPFSTTVLADASLAGRFHLITSSPTVPFGYGYLIATTARTGTASITGKMPDGTAITWSGFLGANGSMPLFVRLYGNKGSLSGTPIVDGGMRTAAAANLKWVRPAAFTDKQFPSGFDLNLTASGAAYVYTPGVRVMGLGAVLPNARATWTPDAMAVPTTQDFSVDASNQALVPSNTDLLNLSLTGSTGLWTGTFKASGTTTLANCYLLINGTTARGFYIAPPIAPSVEKRFGSFTIAAP